MPENANLHHPTLAEVPEESTNWVQPGRVAARAALRDLSRLVRGWDGRDAAPIDPEILAAAARFLDGLDANAVGLPQVVPMTGGRLQLEWNGPERSLKLEFASPATIHYLRWDPGHGVEDEGFCDVGDAPRLAAMLAWLSAR